MGISDFLSKLRSKSMDMKVCMMGPRGVGKTTILTSIFTDSKESIGSNSNLLMTAEQATQAQLTDRKHFLNAVFANRKDINDKPEAGLAASSEISTFDFHFGLKGKDPRINLEIKDFPGEFVDRNPDDVMSFINESTAIFIAIDTPHLMEYQGQFNEVKNKPKIITEFFRKVLPTIKGERLVLLIPLKCERYFHDNRMEEVVNSVKEAYSDLITLFVDSHKVACAITSIQTMGDVEYDKMLCDSIGNVQINEFGTPEQVDYRFCGKTPKHRPLFCVQPLYYLLSFIVAQYKRNKKSSDLISRMLASLFDNDEPLLDEIYNMEKNRRTDLPGYEMLCGSTLFQYSK